MDTFVTAPDPAGQARAQGARVRAQLFGWLLFVVLLGLVQIATIAWPSLSSWAVVPLTGPGLTA